MILSATRQHSEVRATCFTRYEEKVFGKANLQRTFRVHVAELVEHHVPDRAHSADDGGVLRDVFSSRDLCVIQVTHSGPSQHTDEDDQYSPEDKSLVCQFDLQEHRPPRLTYPPNSTPKAAMRPNLVRQLPRPNWGRLSSK
jgi:hypothetical protein